AIGVRSSWVSGRLLCASMRLAIPRLPSSDLTCFLSTDHRGYGTATEADGLLLPSDLCLLSLARDSRDIVLRKSENGTQQEQARQKAKWPAENHGVISLALFV